MKNILTSTIAKLALVVAACAVVVYAASWSVRTADSAEPAQGASKRLTGYAWSDTIGAISFEEDGEYVEVDDDGYLNGFAWSENIGWVKFGDLSDAPSMLNAGARITGDELVGWARACAGTVGGDCASDSRDDGWDGWISLQGFSGDFNSGFIGSGSGAKPEDELLDGTPGPDTYGFADEEGMYGVRLDTNTNTFVGYAWGSTNVGWLDFSTVGIENYVSCVTKEGIVIAGGKTRSITGPRDETTGMCSVRTYQCEDNGSGVGDLSWDDTEVTCGGLTGTCVRGNKTLSESESSMFYVKPLVSTAADCDAATLRCVENQLVDAATGKANDTHMYSRCTVVPGLTEF